MADELDYIFAESPNAEDALKPEHIKEALRIFFGPLSEDNLDNCYHSFTERYYSEGAMGKIGRLARFIQARSVAPFTALSLDESKHIEAIQRRITEVKTAFGDLRAHAKSTLGLAPIRDAISYADVTHGTRWGDTDTRYSVIKECWGDGESEYPYFHYIEPTLARLFANAPKDLEFLLVAIAERDAALARVAELVAIARDNNGMQHDYESTTVALEEAYSLAANRVDVPKDV